MTVACPLPFVGDVIQMAHGGGGRMMQALLDDVFFPAFSPQLHDSAVVPAPAGRLAFTTDGYVVRPTFFPGGDIGSLAVYGTVNDLAMAGARPLWLSASFILEEGLPIDTLRVVVQSMARAAVQAGVVIVTGDTKVVDRGRGDSIYITTSGVGDVRDGVAITPARVRPGDAVLVSGDVGRHGIAVLSARGDVQLDGVPDSDCAPLHELVGALLDAAVDVHCLRDLTRGGLTAALHEIGRAAHVGITVDEARVPVHDGVASACELLGFDPMFVACEGRMVAFVAEADVDRALAAMRRLPVGAGAVRIGRAHEGSGVSLTTRLGVDRTLDLPNGEQLPRIC